MEYRQERDFMGVVQIPAHAYWGAHTQRALENFPLCGYKVHQGMLRAFAMVKKACCRANAELELLETRKAAVIS